MNKFYWFLARFFWLSMDKAPKGIPVIVWDEYYLMRIARWHHSISDFPDGKWITDLPYDDERDGDPKLPLEPTKWRRCPRPPKREREDHAEGAEG